MDDPKLTALIVDSLAKYNEPARNKIRRELQQERRRADSRIVSWLIGAAVAGVWGTFPFVTDTLLRYFLFCLAALCLYKGLSLVLVAFSEKAAPSENEEIRQSAPRRLRRVV